MKKSRLLALGLAVVLALPTSFGTVEAADYSGTNVVTELPGTSRTFFAEDSTKEDWFNVSGYAADGVQDRSQYYEEYVAAGEKDTANYKVVEEDGYWNSNKEYLSEEEYAALGESEKAEYRFVTAEEQFTAAIGSSAKVIQVNAEELELGYYYLVANNIPLGSISLTTDYTGASKQKPPQTNPCLMNEADLAYANSIPLSEGMDGVGVSEFSLSSHTTLFSTTGCRIRHAGISLDNCEDVVIRNFQFDGIYEWDDLYTNETEEQEYTTRKRYGWCYVAISRSNDIWIDHCTFGFAFDGNIDIKNGSSASITWCEFGVQDISHNDEPATTKWYDSEGSELWKSILFMEEYYQKYKAGETDGWHFELYTKYRDQGATPQELLRYAAMHSKVHLCGSGEDSFYTNVNEKITLAFNYYTNVIQRIPMIRQGNGHMYNCVVDNTEYTANSKALSAKGVSGIYTGSVSVNNARDGASIGSDTCVFREVTPVCGVEYQGMDVQNVNSEWRAMVGPMVNYNLVVNSRVIKSDGTDYTGSSYDNNGENPLTAGKWTWGDKASLGNFKWSLWANQDQFAEFSSITNRLEGIEGKLQNWMTANGATEYYKQFYIGSDSLGYDYQCFELDDVEEKLATYGGAQANLFDADDIDYYVMPYTEEKVAENYKTKVVVDVAGGTIADKSDNTYFVEANDSLTLPTETEITKNGYAFAGWKKIEGYNADGTPIYGEANKNVTVNAGENFETVYYTATWEVEKYTLSFNSMGGETVAPIENIEHGKSLSNVKLELPTATRDGFSFQGWYAYTEETGYGAKFLKTTRLYEDTTVYAKWRATQVDVIFNTNGGNEIDTMYDCGYNTTITLPTPEKEGFEFGGWYADANFTKEFTATSKLVESLSDDINTLGSVTLYAKWNETAPQEVILSFDVAGGVTEEAITVTPGAAVGELPVPTKAENVFVGWYADAEYTTEFTTSSAIDADTTIYAKWVMKGDVNDDNVADANDALVILKYVAKMDVTISELQLQQADVDGGDGTVDANDALKVLKYVAKMIDGFDS